MKKEPVAWLKCFKDGCKDSDTHRYTDQRGGSITSCQLHRPGGWVRY